MIFNIDVFLKSYLTDSEFVTLLIIKEGKYAHLEDRIPHLLQLYNLEYIKDVASKKKEPDYYKFRLTKKAKDFLKELEIADINTDSKILFNKVVDLYTTQGLTDKIGNKRELIKRISWFLAEVKIEMDTLYGLIEDYIVTIDDRKYITKAENLFWKRESLYQSKYSLSQSKMYDLITRKGLQQ
jgi:hypothetical protein